jgi:Helix-turn-helix domain
VQPVTVNIAGLEPLVSQLVNERIRQALDGQTTEDPWYDSAAAAQYLGVTRQRIHDLSSQGLLPRVGEKGQRLYYKRSTLDAYREGRAA